jgi:hypothetical protein
VIDAQTYIQLSDALIAGTPTIRDCYPKLDRKARERIRARAAVLLERWAVAEGAAD